MGKAKKLKKLGSKVSRPGPLGDQLARDEVAQPTGRKKDRPLRKDGDEEFVEGQMGRTILKQSLAQLREVQEEEAEEAMAALDDGEFPPLERPAHREKKRPAVSLSSKKKGGSGSDDSSDEDDEDVDETSAAVPQNTDKMVKDFEDELKLAKEDMQILDHFMNKDAAPQRKLADLFRDKITEKQTEIQSHVDASSVQTVTVSPEVQEMCAEVGKILAKYRSGPLPKMFKVIPKMRNWEELVYLTDPDKWSAAAMYQAVRIFVSNLKEAMAQRFFNLVLLPRVRDDISYYKRLNYHLYQALYKAMFKPAAFFKGVLLPLCMSGTCTLREAIIVGSVIAKIHIPILHSAAAILKIAEMDYTGPNSIFLRIFFDKKYALPYRVIDACVYHFLKFEHDRRELPVLWHQALLTFVQRYKEDLSNDQKQSLLDVVKFHTHYTMTAEIRRELMNSKCRGEDDTTMAVDE
ncbi:bystin-like [Eriocheir sinensis]|uniref:bystin-like n=1 Tax=Eriocheir sinensis TaxID=95602 RepID=UPI0021C9C63A|nr:bystin-like [Eriocheir sinensis]XP_050693234.1 bystin-like [Eriocheir sinensis]XP_050693311.1 bystin-like [Eriocheir sinensis]